MSIAVSEGFRIWNQQKKRGERATGEIRRLRGPQKYVRNPLYLGAATTFLGWALLTDSTSSLLGVGFVLVWFRFVQIPFEERELRAIFGEQYAGYSDEVPMLIPFSNRRLR